MFGPLISVLAVILGLVLVGPISPANADSGTCDVSGGYVKPLDGASTGSVTDQPWGSVTWGGTNLHYVVNNGYTIGFCHKAGLTVTETTVTGAAEGDFATPNSGPQGQQQDISHIGYKVISAPSVTEIPKDATAAVDITPATCTKGEVASEGDTQNASWVASDDVTGPGTYSFTANADNNHQFGDGSTQKIYSDDLAGPNAALCDAKDATATVNVEAATCTTGEIASEGDTQNASWVASDDVTGPGTYSFTANAAEGHQFSDGKTSNVFAGDLDGPNKALCEGGGNPGGNNGTIKVDDDGLPGCNVGHSQGGDVCDNGVGNDPHLGCSFYVEWYNYEANATSTVTFSVQDPTGGTVTAVQGTVAPATVQLDGDDASGANEAGFDGSELYKLTFTDAPQQNHGWHVKVTTHTTWSNGSDEKSKVFWVEGDCRVIPETPSVTMDDQCGTANDSGPTYTAENEYWTTTEGDNTVVFHAKDGFYFPAGDNTSEDGKTYTVSYTPNTDEACPGQEIPLTPSVTMDDQCGTANDSGPTYTAENEYWTTTEGDNTVVFHAKDGYYFPAGDNTSEDGMTYTVSYTPNTDESCGDASAGVTFTEPKCDVGATATPGAVTNATWDEDYATVTGPGSYNFVAHAVAGYHFPAGPNVNEDGTMMTFSGELPGSLSGTQDCTVQPEPTQRVEHMSEQSCELAGVHTWDDVYTTTYAWDEATGTYVGTETGPVAENDLLTPYTTQQLEDLGCVEVAGEQTHGHHGGGKHHPEVKGEQAHAPAAAVVPTQVEAGLAGTPAGTPAGGSGNNLPLWALSLGAGMFLVGAGRLRRTSRATR